MKPIKPAKRIMEMLVGLTSAWASLEIWQWSKLISMMSATVGIVFILSSLFSRWDVDYGDN